MPGGGTRPGTGLEGHRRPRGPVRRRRHREGPASGLAFEQGRHIGYPSISYPDDLIMARFGVRAPQATPSTYILDARGRIAWVWFGRVTYPQLEFAIVQVAGS